MERTIKVKLTVAYEGTRYNGWQAQKVGQGIQEKIEGAFESLYGAAFRLHGSSRTDTGVHALGMIAHVEIPESKSTIAARKLPLALNANLPEDIRILDAEVVDAGFHARFDARGKQYRYLVWNHRAQNPLLRHVAWQVPGNLDLRSMRRAAGLLLGKHDFKSFAANRDYEMESTVRTLHRCDIRRSGPLLRFIMEGDGFLYKMCRGIVGTLIQIGQKKIQAVEISEILKTRDRRVAGMTAPAHGLTLWKVFYAPKTATDDS